MIVDYPHMVSRGCPKGREGGEEEEEEEEEECLLHVKSQSRQLALQ